MTPNAANILRWIEALESPDAPRQCYGYYTEDDKFCAMGLARHIFGIENTHRSAADVMCLPEELPRAIVSWNDNDRLTFPQIAAKIREWCAANAVDLASGTPHQEPAHEE